MADASRTPFSDPPAAPQTWGEAFAALPSDTPDASRWPALAQAAARRAARTRRRRIGLALAAGLCALALLPFALRRSEDRAVATAPAPAVATAAQAPAATPDAATPDAVKTTPPAVAPSTDATHRVMPTHTSAPRIAGAAQPTPRHATRRARPASHALRETTPVVADAAAHPATSQTVQRDTLDALYAASAQLETLLALARDTRVDSGPAAALAGGYDADLAAIDARLAQPDLPADQQLQLWQARVDTLEQAAGLESQLRALAASGGRLDGALVTID